MFCKYCGNELRENAGFCMKCGREILPKVDIDSGYDEQIIQDIPADDIEETVIIEDTANMTEDTVIVEDTADMTEDTVIVEDTADMMEAVEEVQNQVIPDTVENDVLKNDASEPVKKGKNKAVKITIIIFALLVLASGGVFGGLKYIEYREEQRLIEEEKSYEEYIKTVETFLQANMDEIGNFILNAEQNEKFNKVSY